MNLGLIQDTSNSYLLSINLILNFLISIDLKADKEFKFFSIIVVIGYESLLSEENICNSLIFLKLISSKIDKSLIFFVIISNFSKYLNVLLDKKQISSLSNPFNFIYFIPLKEIFFNTSLKFLFIIIYLNFNTKFIE